MIQEKIQDFDIDVQVKFTIFSLGRVVELYGLFIREIEENNLDDLSQYEDGLKKLQSIYLTLKNEGLKTSEEELKAFVDTGYSLAVHWEDYSSFQSTVATQVALLSTSVVEFMISKDFGLFEEIQMNISEIINILESEKFYSINPDGDYKVCEERISERIRQDETDQLAAIEAFNNTDVALDFLVDKYKIEL